MLCFVVDFKFCTSLYDAAARYWLQVLVQWYWYWYLEPKYWYLYLRHGYWYWFWYLRLKYWYLYDWVLATTLNHCNYLPEIYWQKWILFSFIKNTLKCSGDHIMFCWLLFNCGFNRIRFSCAFMVIICGTNLCFWRILYYILKDKCLKVHWWEQYWRQSMFICRYLFMARYSQLTAKTELHPEEEQSLR